MQSDSKSLDTFLSSLTTWLLISVTLGYIRRRLRKVFSPVAFSASLVCFPCYFEHFLYTEHELSI